MTLEAVKALARVVAVIEAAEPTLTVYRSRARPLPEGVDQALHIRLGPTSSTMRVNNGGSNWAIGIYIAAVVRVENDDPADEISGALIERAHNALIADMTLGDPYLQLDPAFSLVQDEEDLDETVSAMTALYSLSTSTVDAHA